MTETSTAITERGRAASRPNPLLTRSPLPLEAPPFDELRDDHYEPAMELGMEEHLVEIEAIANQSAAPTFENTIVAMERSGRLLQRSASVFFIVASANSSDTLQETMETVMPRLAAHSDEIYLNDALFRRVESVYRDREQLRLTAEGARLLDRYHRDFVRAGARLSDADKARVRALNTEDAKLQAEFENRLREASRSAAVIVDDRAQLEGLSAIDVDAAAAAARARGLEGKWMLPLQNTTQQPALGGLRDRRLRERLFLASTRRAEHGDDNDTRELVRRMARIRAERGALLGYANHAAYVLEEEMAHTPEARLKLLTNIAPAAIRRAKAEQAAIQSQIDSDRGGFAVEPWDWQYYAEHVRLAQFALDESLLKPYLELDRVLNDGVFYAATQLFGVAFRERHDLPVYHPDVRVFDVIEADGEQLALFYADFFKRDNKDGGAWSNEFVPAVGLLGTKAVVANVTNFTKPALGQPALISFDDVITLFHEFGHALHAMFARVRYPTLVGTPADFS
jgi:peptidyl-dipeptidase Dcp